LIEDAAAMKAAIPSDCADMTAAKAIYTTATSNGVHAATATLGSLQSQVLLLTGTADAGLDALIVAAFDGTGAFEAAATAGADACPARKEFIVKSIQNNLFSKMTINHAALGTADGNARATWVFNGPTTPAIAPFATGVKRAKNYDTCTEGAGSQSPCTAPTNTAINAALDATPAAGSGALVSAQIMATYIQATLRYVNKMDKDMAGGGGTASWKNQGEGWGFSLVIADSLEAANAATIEGLYNLATRNTAFDNYCTAFTAITADPLYVPGNVGTLNEGLPATTGGTTAAPDCTAQAAGIDCAEATAATSTCTECGQDLYTLTNVAVGGGAACTGSSTLCGNGDGDTGALLVCGMCSGNTGGEGDVACAAPATAIAASATTAGTTEAECCETTGQCSGNTDSTTDYTCTAGSLIAASATTAGADDATCCDIACVEATAATSTCTACDQELYTLTSVAVNGGTACSGSSTLCGNGDASLVCGMCSGNTAGAGDYTCTAGSLIAASATTAGADDATCCTTPVVSSPPTPTSGASAASMSVVALISAVLAAML
jgi:hypothetical protein